MTTGWLYRALADVIVLMHIAFIAFAVFGGLLALRWRWAPWGHVPAAIWSAAVAAIGWPCPLTPLENSLRRAGGSLEYSGPFVEHYIVPILYPAGLTREIQVGLGGVVLAVNLIVYWLVWRHRRRDGIRASREG